MKISLIGLSGCGKTSLYSVIFAEKTPEETKGLSPTILYETRRHPFLGLEISIFDFGGQDQYIKEYLDKPKIFMGTDVLIPVVDLHDPNSFDKSKKYFEDIIKLYKENYQKPKICLFYHKYDTEDYQKELLDTNIIKAREIFSDIFKDYKPQTFLTSIYDQQNLTKIFRDILMGSYSELKGHIEKAEKHLQEINARIIISDISGNVLVHNVQGVSSGLSLRADLRDFISSCNVIRENVFLSDSAEFKGNSEEGKELQLYIFKYILAVLIMKSEGELDPESSEKIRVLLKDMKLFSDIIVSIHSE